MKQSYRKILIALLSVGFCLLLLAACTDESGEDKRTDSPNSIAQTSMETPDESRAVPEFSNDLPILWE